MPFQRAQQGAERPIHISCGTLCEGQRWEPLSEGGPQGGQGPRSPVGDSSVQASQPLTLFHSYREFSGFLSAGGTYKVSPGTQR